MTMKIALKKGLSGYLQAYLVMLASVIFWTSTQFFSHVALMRMEMQLIMSVLVFIIGLSLVFIHRWRRIYTLALLTVLLWGFFWFFASQWLGEITTEQMQLMLPFIGGVAGAENMGQNLEQLSWMLRQGGAMSIFLWLSFGWIVAKHHFGVDYVAKVKLFKVPLGVQIFTLLLSVLWLIQLGLKHFGYHLNIGWFYFVGTNAGGIILRIYWLAGIALLLRFVEGKKMPYKHQWSLLRFLVFLHFLPVIGVLSLFFLAGYAILPTCHRKRA